MFPRVTVQTSKLRLGEGRLTFPARIGGPMMSSCPYSVPLMGIGAVFLRSENVSFFLFYFYFYFYTLSVSTKPVLSCTLTAGHRGVFPFIPCIFFPDQLKN
jgi:hypothetical protein